MKSISIENLISWKYKELGASMDGGSITIILTTSLGQIKEIFLGQNVIAEYYEELNSQPGRIYVEGQIIEKRSKIEEALIEFLENTVSKEMTKDELELLNEKLVFIKSIEYLNFVPVKLELSEKRRKYLKLIEIVREQNLNPIESKFLELKNEKINIREFEEWVYANEDLIKSESSNSIYDALIILNYRTKDSRTELIKILSIDFRRLELYELSLNLEQLIYTENLRIENIRHDGDNSMYDPYFRYYFDFKVNGINIGMNNPFRLNFSNYSNNNRLRSEEFEKRFLKPYKFFEMILSNLNSSKLKIIVKEELADIDPNAYTKAYCGTKEDIVIQIDKHRLIMNKDYIATEMKAYWHIT